MKKYILQREWDVQAIQWFKHGDVPGLAVDPNNPDNAILNPDEPWNPIILKPRDYYIVHRCGQAFSLTAKIFERDYKEYIE